MVSTFSDFVSTCIFLCNCIMVNIHDFRGLKFFGKNRTERVEALADSLINNGYDVVCLQELWCATDFKYLKQSCEHIFKYVHYFHRYLY